MGASIPVPKRMNDVELAVKVRESGNELRMRQSIEIILFGELVEQLFSFRHNAAEVGKTRAALADIDRADLTGPTVDVAKR